MKRKQRLKKLFRKLFSFPKFPKEIYDPKSKFGVIAPKKRPEQAEDAIV